MPPNHVLCVATSTPGVFASSGRYEIGSGMIRLTLWISTSRSAPAMSTPNVNAVRMVIRMPNRKNATNITSEREDRAELPAPDVLPDERQEFHALVPSFSGGPFHQRALLEVQRPRRPFGRVRIVRDHDDRLAVIAVQRLQQIEDFIAGLAVEVAGWLVAEEQRRVGDDGAGDADALLLAARELPRIVSRAIGQARPP